jgi:hypothetical protein
MTEHGIPIWFFIGALLLVYGVLIFGYVRAFRPRR